MWVLNLLEADSTTSHVPSPPLPPLQQDLIQKMGRAGRFGNGAAEARMLRGFYPQLFANAGRDGAAVPSVYTAYVSLNTLHGGLAIWDRILENAMGKSRRRYGLTTLRSAILVRCVSSVINAKGR